MKTEATYAGDPRNHATDLAELRAEVERLKAALWRAPEDWLKGDPEAWFALTGEELDL